MSSPESASPNMPRGRVPSWQRAVPEAFAFVLAFAFLALVWFLLRPLALLLAGAILAAALAPVVEWIHHKLPRVVSVLAVYLVLLTTVVAIGAVALLPLLNQAGTLLTAGPEQVDRARRWFDQRGPVPVTIDQLAGALGSSIDRFSEVLLSLPLRIASAATELLVIVVMSIYWLLAAPALRSFVLSLVAPNDRDRTDHILQELCSTMGGYVRGMVVDMLALTVLIYVGLLILGTRYALVLALIAGAGALVPIVGPVLSALPALAVAMADSPLRAALVLVLYVVVHHVESDVLLPNLMARQAAIPPLLVLFALAAGAATGNVLGVLLAIPLAGACRVITLRLLVPMVRGWTGAAA
jgi:predicted PurR-regulated permease PerM